MVGIRLRWSFDGQATHLRFSSKLIEHMHEAPCPDRQSERYFDKRYKVNMMKHYFDLTPVQNKILNYLEEQIRERGNMPSLREAAQDNGVSHASIAQTIQNLEDKGYIKRGGKYSRTLHLLKHTDAGVATFRARTIPVIGTIAAGLPLYAQQEYEGTIAVDALLYKGDHLFALKISGDSMKDAGIMDGDMVICEPRQFAENGDIVVALINHDEATVKRFYLRKKGIELKPENPEYKSKQYGFGDVLVQGKVIGLFRGPEAFGS